MNAMAWPSKEDLSIAAGAILRIQHVYDLDTYDVSPTALVSTLFWSKIV